jgi:hypothetical protein
MAKTRHSDFMAMKNRHGVFKITMAILVFEDP